VLDAQFDATLGTFHIEVGLRSERGKTTVLLGESGSGKSTVLRFLAGLLQADHGTLVLDDELYVDTSRKFSVPAEHRPIGYVFQEYVLFPHLSVFDNVAFGLRMQSISKADTRRRVGEALEQVHLTGYDDRHPKELSGGQQQRVAIARALALQPRLLLLDESLSALDIQTRHQVTRELRELLHRLNLTTVMVSHQYSDALNFADHIVVLENGTVIQEGTHLDLLRHPHSSYIAEMVGVNRFPGKVVSNGGEPGTCRVVLQQGDGSSIEIDATSDGDELMPGSDAAVILHPRTVTLQQSRPAESAGNVCAGRVVQATPVSAEVSSGDQGMRGLIRVITDIGPNLPTLRAEFDVNGADGGRLTEGETVYATFAPADARVYPRTRVRIS
jgi:molybdate transport system ATP-binding protein